MRPVFDPRSCVQRLERHGSDPVSGGPVELLLPVVVNFLLTRGCLLDECLVPIRSSLSGQSRFSSSGDAVRFVDNGPKFFLNVRSSGDGLLSRPVLAEI